MNNLALIPGFDERLYWLFISLYTPLISRSHLQDQIQYFIYYNSELAGCLSVNSENYVQIIMAPWYRGKNLAHITLTQHAECVKKLPKVNWVAYYANYPTLKLLHKLGGGLVPTESKTILEGFYKPGTIVCLEMRTALEKTLDYSKQEYKIWTNEVYTKRKDIEQQLKTYLTEVRK